MTNKFKLLIDFVAPTSLIANLTNVKGFVPVLLHKGFMSLVAVTLMGHSIGTQNGGFCHPFSRGARDQYLAHRGDGGVVWRLNKKFGGQVFLAQISILWVHVA